MQDAFQMKAWLVSRNSIQERLSVEYGVRTAVRAVARNFRGGGQNMRITKTRAIRLGGLVVGGGAPVMV